MSTKKPKDLKLMYRGKNLMDDFVWATHNEVKEYKKKGYRFLNDK